MKNPISLPFLIASISIGTIPVLAQLAPSPISDPATNPGPVSSDSVAISSADFEASLAANGKVSYVVQKGGDGQLWQSVHKSTNTLGEVSLTTNRVQQIGTGMHYFDGTAWKSSDAIFTQTVDEFVANKVQHRTKIKKDLNVGGAIFMTTPDEKQIYTTPVALGLYEPQDGKFLVLGEITNCTGLFVEGSSNQIVFQDPFADAKGQRLCGALVYTIDQASFEQDYVWQGFLDVQDYGFSTNCWLQVISEIQSAPEPEILERPVYIEQDEKLRNTMASSRLGPVFSGSDQSPTFSITLFPLEKNEIHRDRSCHWS